MTFELYKALKKHWLINFLITILSAIGFFLIFLLLYFNRQGNGLVERSGLVFENYALYILQDNYIGESIIEFWEEEDVLERLLFFVDEGLEKAEKFHPLIISTQFIELQADGFLGGESFQENYSFGFNFGEMDGSNGAFYQIMTVQINERVMDFFPLEVSEGRLFEASDFTFNGDFVPVILGSDYLGYYEIGDLMVGDYNFSTFTFEVVGILEARQEFFDNYGLYALDNRIIMPHQKFLSPQTDEEKNFQVLTYTSRLKAFLLVEDTMADRDYMINSITALSQQTNIEVEIFGMDRELFLNNEIRSLIFQHQDSIRGLIASLLFSISGIIFLASILRYEKQKSVYHHYYFLGRPMISLWGSIFLENLLISSISFLAAAIYIVTNTFFAIDFTFIYSYQLSVWEIISGFMITIPEFNPILVLMLFWLALALVFPSVRLFTISRKGV